MLEARSAEARPRIRGEASLEARSAEAPRARAPRLARRNFDASRLHHLSRFARLFTRRLRLRTFF